MQGFTEIYPTALAPSESQPAAYALTLRSVEGHLLPVRIARPAAQVLTCLLAGFVPARPLGIEVLAGVLAIGAWRPLAVRLDRAALAGGVAEVLIGGGSAPATPFAVRLSDGIAIALRWGCGLYASVGLLQAEGLRPHILAAETLPADLATLSLGELRHWETKAARAGDYAGAARVQQALRQRGQ